MYIKILFLIMYFLSLNAYELPSVNLSSDNKSEIVLFNATSIIVENRPSYVIKWKTINASNVNITYIGKVALSGSMTITAEEYNKGPITLTASNKKNSSIDTLTINDFKDNLPPPIKFKEKKETQGFTPYYQNQRLYNNRGYPRRLRPIDRRSY